MNKIRISMRVKMTAMVRRKSGGQDEDGANMGRMKNKTEW